MLVDKKRVILEAFALFIRHLSSVLPSGRVSSASSPSGTAPGPEAGPEVTEATGIQAPPSGQGTALCGEIFSSLVPVSVGAGL